MPPDDLWSLIGDCIPDDHSRQVLPEYWVPKLTSQSPQKVLDLGCGTGRSLEMFRRYSPTWEWHGLDVEDSPEVAQRTLTGDHFHSFDGVTIPFEAESFDLVYSNQVFEHVPEPARLLAEVARVLRKGGSFIGSVSYLEPYHSLSLWNYTPWGWHTLLRRAGLRPVEFRPGIDSIALIQRSYRGCPKEALAWFRSSPLNEEIDEWGKTTGRRAALVNLRKLQYCGHLSFYASR